jgi:parallel beta-helix repeat protein
MRKLTRLILIAVVATLVLSGILFLFINYPYSNHDTSFQPSKTYPQIYIRSNGNIETNGANSSAIPISRNGNVYTLNAAMELENFTVEKSNIVLDGNNFPIQIVGPGGYKHGPTIAYLNVVDAENVTLHNLNIPRFQLLFQGCLRCQTSNNTFVSVIMNNSRAISVSENSIWYGATVSLTNSSDCTVTNNAVAYFTLKNAYNNKLLNNNMSMVKELAIRIDDSSSNLFYGNRIERSIKLLELTGNSGDNLFVGNFVEGSFNLDPTINCSGTNTFYHNNFVYVYWNQTLPSTPNNWDGNYWNDYEGKDKNGDGIGDSPHLIDANNQDIHPLVNPIDLKLETQPTVIFQECNMNRMLIENLAR